VGGGVGVVLVVCALGGAVLGTQGLINIACLLKNTHRLHNALPKRPQSPPPSQAPSHPHPHPQPQPNTHPGQHAVLVLDAVRLVDDDVAPMEAPEEVLLLDDHLVRRHAHIKGGGAVHEVLLLLAHLRVACGGGGGVGGGCVVGGWGGGKEG